MSPPPVKFSLQDGREEPSFKTTDSADASNFLMNSPVFLNLGLIRRLQPVEIREACQAGGTVASLPDSPPSRDSTLPNVIFI